MKGSGALEVTVHTRAGPDGSLVPHVVVLQRYVPPGQFVLSRVGPAMRSLGVRRLAWARLSVLHPGGVVVMEAASEEEEVTPARRQRQQRQRVLPPQGCVAEQSEGDEGEELGVEEQPGQVRVCGLTFDAALAPAVASAQAAWQERLGRELRYADPTKVQLAFTGSPIDQHLSRAVVCNKLARLLGLEGDNSPLDAPLPEGPLLLESALQPCGDPARGGAGLQATVPLKKNAVLGVVGGYVMPAGAAEDFVNFGHEQCRKEVANRLAAVVEGTSANLATAWKLLAGAFRMPLSEGAGGAPAELSMLGYGNLAALVNDPRVNPRDWAPGNDVESQEAAERANCAVVPVSVRGLVLPVLVALRNIAPGEQLLRDYGAGWWRQLAPDWEVAEDDGLDVARLLHGTQHMSSTPAGGLQQPPPGAPQMQGTEAAFAQQPAAEAVDTAGVSGEKCALAGLVMALGRPLNLTAKWFLRSLARALTFLGAATVVGARCLLSRHGLPYVSGMAVRFQRMPGFKLVLWHESTASPATWGDLRVTADIGQMLEGLASASKVG
ncbi:hypothetical protein GPECTOR_30g185 [Gonium pectorale]|uniref:SET domain-containing protein n=1 Tax=Gonium pectorale TaxID=33097 RepID=A0A150GFI3_GONPE|nr:hypothetical protein GPECTOR_30g185 [Gonium pectorale]|eukprot:KXZ48090.1 hypothetical protein GPECTOR_30g185 [Gonium pectorale]